MKIIEIETNKNKSVLRLLSGDDFDENIQLTMVGDGRIRDRIEALAEIVAGKRVVHVGCCDHLESIEGRRRSGRWLHDHLIVSAETCWGVDVNAEAVSFLAGQPGLSDVYCLDVCDGGSSSPLMGVAWDLLVIPEVLEHVGNPVDFLERIRQVHLHSFEKVIITVPNALRAGSFRGALLNQETVNSDHRFYFTPYTILKVVTDAGFEPISIEFVTFSELTGWSGVIKRAILKRFPILAEDLLVIAKFR